MEVTRNYETKRKKRYNDKKRKQFCSGKSGNKQGWSDAGLNLFNLLCHQVDVIRKKMVNVEKQIKQQFIVESNHNRGITHSDDSAPNEETNITAIKEDYLGGGMDSIVKLIDKRKDKEINDSDSDSDDSDNE